MVFQLHRWLGVALAVFLLLSALTGGLLLWSDEFQRWRYPEVAAGVGIAPSAPTLETIMATAPGPIGTVAMPRPGLPAYQLYLRDGSEALHAAGSGAPIAHWGPLDTLPSVLFEAHVRLFAGEPGHIAVGAIGLALVGLALSGLITWWGRRRRMPLRRLLPRSTSNLALMKAHAAQGATTAVLALFLFLSGAAIVFHEPAAAVLNGLLGSREPLRPTVTRAEGAVERPHWRALLEAAERGFPDATLRFVTLPREPDQPAYLRLRLPGELHPNGRSYLVVHPQSGEILERIDATAAGTGPTVFNALYPLHAGKTGWTGHRLVLFITAMALAYLSASGLAVFLRRRLRHRRG